MDLLRREWIQQGLIFELQELTQQMRETRKRKEQIAKIWAEAAGKRFEKKIRVAGKDNQERLVRPADWAPPRYIESQLAELPCHYVQIVELSAQSIQPGKPFKAIVSDGYASIPAIFKPSATESATAAQNLHLIKKGALIQVTKCRFRFPGSCQNSLQEGITRGDQRSIPRTGKRGGSDNKWTSGPKTPYSNAIAICAYRPELDLNISTEPTLQIEESVVLGGNDHVYGEPKPVRRVAAVRTAIADFPVLPISLPSPEQWGSNIVQRVAGMWLVEIAWHKFASSLTCSDARNLAEIKYAFGQKFQRNDKAMSKVIRAAKRTVFDPLYHQECPVTGLCDIRRVYIELQWILEPKRAASSTPVSYIPGTRRLLLVTASESQSAGRGRTHGAFSSQEDMMGTQSFATQFPVAHYASVVPSQSDSSPDIECRIAKFRFDEVDDAERDNFCIIMRTLYEKVEQGEHRGKGASAISDHIADFYAVPALRAVEIGPRRPMQEACRRVVVEPPPTTLPQQHQTDGDITMEDVSSASEPKQEQRPIIEMPRHNTPKVSVKRPLKLRSKEDINRLLSSKKPRLAATTAPLVDAKPVEPTPSVHTKPSQANESTVPIPAPPTETRKDKVPSPVQQKSYPPDDQPTRLPLERSGSAKTPQRVPSPSTILLNVISHDDGEEHNITNGSEPRDLLRGVPIIPSGDESRKLRTKPSIRTTEEYQKRQPRARGRDVRKHDPDAVVPASDDESEPILKLVTRPGKEISPKRHPRPSGSRSEDHGSSRTEPHTVPSGQQHMHHSTPHNPDTQMESQSPVEAADSLSPVRVKIEEQSQDHRLQTENVKPQRPPSNPPPAAPDAESDSDDSIPKIIAAVKRFREELERKPEPVKRARVPRDQATALSKASALWPPPNGDLQNRVRIEKQPTQKGGSHAPLEYPRDFRPHDDPIENSTVAGTQSQRPGEQREGEHSDGGETVDWEPTPPEKLKVPNRRIVDDEGEATNDGSDEDSNESSDDDELNPNPPPASSAEQYQIPFKPEDLRIPGEAATPPMAPVRGSSPAFRPQSYPYASSAPSSPSAEESAHLTAEQPDHLKISSEKDQEIPKSQREASTTIPKESTSHGQVSGHEPYEEEDYEEENGEEEEASEAQVQVLKTPSQAPPRDISKDDEDRESEEEADDDNGEEDEEVPASSLVEATPEGDNSAADSPGNKEVDSMEIGSVPTKAGSVTSPMIKLKTRMVSIDEDVKVRDNLYPLCYSESISSNYDIGPGP
ncbi:hypothetical protein TWF696_007288 [Orbilia brochopaga]|uniref:Uncharacterized protein n=1 Tax=Orbilia brochopaga TaxID=3140254 RepID=A0AAV9UUS2_9PEZI